MKKGILILIALYCTSCFNFVNYPYKRKLLFESKNDNLQISTIWYYYRRKTDQHTLIINYTSKCQSEMRIYFSAEYNGIEIIRRRANENIVICDSTFKSFNRGHYVFETMMITDTLNFRNPELDGEFAGLRIGREELQSLNRNDVQFEKVSVVEKKILSKTYDACFKHGLTLTPFDTTKFVAWMKYIGDCK